MDLLIFVGNFLLEVQPYSKTLAPFLAGAALFCAAQSKKTKGFWLRIGLLAVFVSVGNWIAFNYVVQPQFAGQVAPFPIYDVFVAVLFFAAGAATYFVWLREGQPWLDANAERVTKRSSLERNKKTDVREISQFLPEVEKQYDPRQYFSQKKGFFLGLNGESKAFWAASTLPHVQVVGTTGAGKGVVLGSLAAQCLQADEAVFWLDPKDDEWAPHLMANAAAIAVKPFHFVDLRPAAPPQLNLFYGATKEEREELLLAGFSLSEKGAESDFYSIDDRWGAATVAADYQPGDTPASLFNRNRETLEEKAKKFFGLFREMAELPAVNAKHGVDFVKVVEEGGAVYVVGSMRNAKVIRMQRMLLVRIIQICERRDRTQGKLRPVCAILDEAKYHISKPFLESLGAARDKGLHVILAHQSQADLRDCPADLNSEAVLGAVMENCSLKLVYRVEDPETAEWMARKSGRIQVDDEVRRVSKNAALSEVVNDERQIRQTERFLIDENMILNLRKSQAVVFGNGLPHFITTSPIPTIKKPENLKTNAYSGDEIIKAAELI
jgi:type IV secretory pathway TraG/TraD family ATPase VirD4